MEITKKNKIVMKEMIHQNVGFKFDTLVPLSDGHCLFWRMTLFYIFILLRRIHQGHFVVVFYLFLLLLLLHTMATVVDSMMRGFMTNLIFFYLLNINHI